MKSLLMSTAIVAMTAAAAQAGSLADPVVEPAPEAMAPAPMPVATGADWTGFYGGLSVGKLMAETGDLEEDGTVYGAFGGYNYDFGQFVLGGELDYQATDDFTIGGADIDSVTRLKVRGGYDLGQALIYATAGVARADTSLDGDVDGAVYGLGLDYAVTQNVVVGAEYLVHDFNDIAGTSTDLDADTISLRAAFKF